MTEHALAPHPGSAAPAAVRAVAASAALVGAQFLHLEFRLTAELALLAIPPRAPAARADRLWEHTCFEAFVAGAGAARYSELNFSPSTQWAGYEFDDYRQGMRPLLLAAPPRVVVAETATELRVTAAVEIAELGAAPWPWRIGLTAVVEDRAGARGYYALRHPRDVPDFHDAAGFAIALHGSTR